MTDLPLCPKCSLFARRHPELLHTDYIRRPSLKVTARGTYLVNYCPHSFALFGPHESADSAAKAWTFVVEQLEADLSPEKREDIADYESRLQQFAAKAEQFAKRIGDSEERQGELI